MKAPETKQRELVPAGTHKAVCYTICDLGTHEEEYMGTPKWTRKLLLTWEFPEVRIKYEVDGKPRDAPRVIGKEYTFSLHEKSNLTKDLTSWVGNVPFDFEFKDLAGMNALLNIVHQETRKGNKFYDKVAGVMKPLAGTPTTTPENPIIFYSVKEHGLNLPEALTSNKRMKWLVDKIESSLEIQKLKNPHKLTQNQQSEYNDAGDTRDFSNGDPDDDLPF